MSQQRFQILGYWVEKRTSIGMPILPQLFTDEQLMLWKECMKASADSPESQRQTITAPSPYKKDTKWRVWKEKFMTYIGSKVGQCKAPLNFCSMGK